VIVIDASVVANVVGDDHADGEAARHRLGHEVDVAMPDLADVETAGVLRRRWLAGALSDRRFEEAITLLASLPIDRFAAAPFLPRAFELRANVTAFDAMYVAVAEILGCPLLTGDGRLASAPGLRCRVEVLTVT
jgi:predicted nucleic acid-binding protein